MGIRVHKAVGWGVNDFTPPESFDSRLDDLVEMPTEEFVAWMTSHEDELCKRISHVPVFDARYFRDRLKLRNKADKLPELYKCISYNDEFGDGNCILFCSLEMADTCRRYDDIVDWLEEDDKVRWRFLEKNIYPYEKGEVPFSVVAICVFLGIEEIIPRLREALYVYWS